MSEEIDKAMEFLFPWGRESLDDAVKKIRQSFSKDIWERECFWAYVSFKALLSVHKIENPDVKANIDYLVWYIQRKLQYSYSECYELINCMADNDLMIFAWLNNFWFYSSEEDEIWEESWDDFWYSIDNPIKTAWIAYSDRYLDHLYDNNFWHITYKRLWSKTNEHLWLSPFLQRMNIKLWNNWSRYRCVDIYEIYDENWNYLRDLYICPYYQSTTKQSPRGLKYTW